MKININDKIKLLEKSFKSIKDTYKYSKTEYTKGYIDGLNNAMMLIKVAFLKGVEND